MNVLDKKPAVMPAIHHKVRGVIDLSPYFHLGAGPP